ncbi:hypothetical protein N665_0347s0024 [Sinapis alba]|nr:hypothetical protein N665_0347s0024 [Sinapis alba]
MREHALISGLDCHEYPSRYLKLGGTKFVDYYFGGEEKITIKDVEKTILSMKPCNDRLKMAVLFFLGRVIRGKTKDIGPLDPFILRIVDDLEVCRTFPWGHLTFEDAIKKIKHMMELLKGEVHDACGFPGFVIPLEDINNVLVPTVGKEILMRRIIDEEPRYHSEGSKSDTVKQKKIWWKKLYKSDVVARVFTKKKEKENITLLEGSSSISGLELSLKSLEERLLKSMEQGFSCLNGTMDTKLEAMNSRMIWDYSRGDYSGGHGSKENSENGKEKEEEEKEEKEEKDEEAENLEEKDEEAKNLEEKDREGENSENGKKRTENSEEENEAERRKVETDAAWR